MMFGFEIKKGLRKKTYLLLFFAAFAVAILRFSMPIGSQETLYEFPGMADSSFLLNALMRELPDVKDTETLSGISEVENPETYFPDLEEIDRLSMEEYNLAPNPEAEDQLDEQDRKERLRLLIDKEQAILHFVEAHLQKMPQFDEYYETLQTVVRWHQVEVEYALAHDVPLAYQSFMGALKEDNLASVLYANFPYYFGPIFFFLLAIAFHSTFSRERESGTLDLLWTQPTHRIRRVTSKAGAMMVGVLTYGLGIFSGAVVGCLLYHKSLGGFTRLLRLLTTLDSVQGIPTGLALFEMFLGVLALSLFFSGILLLLSLYFSSAVSLAGAVMLITLANIITFTGESALQPYNPAALMDYVRAMTGRTPMGLGGFLETDLGQTAWGLGSYLIWAGAGVLLLSMALFPLRESTVHTVRLGRTSAIHSVSSLLQQKIVHRPVFRLYLVGTLLISALLFFQAEYTVRYAQNHPELNANVYASMDQNIAFWENALAYEESSEGQAAFLGVSVDDVPPLEEWHPALRESYDEGIHYNREQLNLAQKQKESQLNHEEAYREGNGRVFWQTQNELNQSLYAQESFGSEYAKAEELTAQSLMLTKRVITEAETRNVAPVFSPMTVVPNVHEGYGNALDWAGERRSNAGEDTSASYWLYRLIVMYRLPIVALLLLGLMVLGGYSLDKEEGDQLALIWTQPLSRMRYHVALVAKQFFIGALVLLLLLLVHLGMGALAEGVGPWNFPLPFYEAEGMDVRFISLWLFLVKTFAFLLAYLFFYSSLSALLSLYVRQEAQVFVGLAGITVAGLSVSRLLPPLAKSFMPFSYLAGDMVADGSLYFVDAITRLPYVGSLGVVVAWGILFLLIGMWRAQRRQNV